MHCWSTVVPDKHKLKSVKLQALLAAFGTQLPERLAAIRHLWAEVQEHPNGEPQDSEFYRQIHSLAGSAGTFGYHQLGACARQLEQFLLQKKAVAYSDSDNIRTIDSALTQLELLATMGADGYGCNKNAADPSDS